MPDPSPNMLLSNARPFRVQVLNQGWWEWSGGNFPTFNAARHRAELALDEFQRSRVTERDGNGYKVVWDQHR